LRPILNHYKQAQDKIPSVPTKLTTYKSVATHEGDTGISASGDRKIVLNAVAKSIIKGRRIGNSSYSKMFTATRANARYLSKQIREILIGEAAPMFTKEDTIVFSKKRGNIQSGVPYRITDVQESEGFTQLIADNKSTNIKALRLKVKPETTIQTLDGNIAVESEVSVPMVASNAELKQVLGAGYADYIDYLRQLKSNFDKSTGINRGITGKKLVEASRKNLFMFDIIDPKTKKVLIYANLAYNYVDTFNNSEGAFYEVSYIDEVNLFNTLQEKLKYKKYSGDNKKLAYKEFNAAMFNAISKTSKRAVILTDKRKANADMIFPNIVMKQDKFGNEFTSGSLANSAYAANKGKETETRDKLIFNTELDINNSKEAALLQALNSAQLYKDTSNKEISKANSILMAQLAVSETDPRVLAYGKGLQLYNLRMYDKYVNNIVAELAKSSETFKENFDVAFDLRIENVTNKYNADISFLHRQIEAAELSGASSNDLDMLNNMLAQAEDNKEKILLSDSVIDLIDAGKKEIADALEILDKESLTVNEINRVRTILETWQTASDVKNVEDNLFLTPGELSQNITNMKALNELGLDAQILNNALLEITKDVITNEVSNNLGEEFEYSDLRKLRNKVYSWTTQFFSVNKVDNPIIAFMFKIVSKAKNLAEMQAIRDSQILVKLVQALKNKDFNMAAFWQKDDSGLRTGMLIDKYSLSFMNAMRYVFDIAPETTKKGKNISKLYTSFAEKTEVLDMNKFLTPEKKEEYRQELLALGIPEYAVNEAFSEATDKLIAYEDFEKSYLQALSPSGSLTDEQMDTFLDWKRRNSPFIRKTIIDDALKFGISPKKDSLSRAADKYITIIPLKTFKGKKKEETGYYDLNYKKIVEDKDAMEFYSKAKEISVRAKRAFASSRMTNSELGYAEAEAVHGLLKGGVANITKKITWDRLKTGISRKVEEKDSVVAAPYTQKYIKDASQTVSARIYAEYKNILEANEITAPNKVQRDIAMAEAREVVDDSMSDDILNALNVLNKSALTHQYKHAVKPQIELARSELTKRSENTLVAGERRDMWGMKVNDQDIENAIKMADYYLDKEFYDIKNEDQSAFIPVKVYTDADRKEFELYKKKARKPAMKIEEVEHIGRVVSVNSVIDKVISFMRLTTMGWNFQSAVMNALQGQVANIIHASENEAYDYETYKQAQVSFATEQKKFINIVKSYAIIGDVMYDFKKDSAFEKDMSTMDTIKDWAAPFAGTKKAEMWNQGVVMIAMMKNKKVLNEETGETMPMWDALNELGELKEGFTYQGYSGDEAIAEVVVEIKSYIAKIHGDYINPKKIQEKSWGRALTMFKLWAFDPFLARFGGTRYDYISKKMTRGRVVSAIETLVKEKLNPMEIRRKMKAGELTELEAKSIRATLADLTAIAITYLVYMITRSLLCAGDSNTVCGGRATTYLVNLLKRLTNETSTFYNPSVWADFISNPAAVVKYLKDIGRIIGYAEDAAFGVGEDKGTKALKLIAKQTPIVRRAIVEENLMTEIQRDY